MEDFEKLFFMLKGNPFPKETRTSTFGLCNEIVFSQQTQQQITQHTLSWADKLLTILIKQSYLTAKILETQITTKKQQELDEWMGS